MDTPIQFAARYTCQCLTARDVTYARRWFVHQHFFRTSPAQFRDVEEAAQFFDGLCEDNALTIDVLREWAKEMYELDNPEEEYES